MSKLLEIEIYRMLQSLTKRESSFFFRYPVNTFQYECPDYYQIILNPVDLNTIKFNFKKGKYYYYTQVVSDLNQICINCYLYNKKDHPLRIQCDRFQDCLNTCYKNLNQIILEQGWDPNRILVIGIEELKEMERIDQKINKISVQCFMDMDLYYFGLFQIDSIYQKTLTWLNDFTKNKAQRNIPSLQYIIREYEIGKIQKLDTLEEAYLKHLDIIMHEEFHIHFSQLKDIISLENNQFGEESQTFVQSKKTAPITIKIKITKNQNKK